MKGKAKIDFENWLNQSNYYFEYTVTPRNMPEYQQRLKIDYEEFELLPPTMQQGVIRDFFESKGIIITIHYESMMGYYFSIHKDNVLILNDDTDTPFSNGYSNYSTAFTHAIDKACDVYGGDK